MNTIKPILLVEDDLVDVMTVQRSFKELKVINPLIVKHHGEDALSYLKSHAEELPCVIILDINMPKMNGHEFLKQLKQYPIYKDIPIVMLTSSKEQQDVDDSFDLGISGYILKSVEYRSFLDSIQVLKSFWRLEEG